MWRLAIGLVVAAAFGLASGCGGGRKGLADVSPDGGDGPVGEDAPIVVDAAPDGDGDAAGDAVVTPRPVSFVFTNATGRTIYIQEFGLSGQQYWSLNRGNSSLRVDNACAICDCGSCPACAVCGRGLARVKELVSGARHEWSWDGRIWTIAQDACGGGNLACEQDEAVAPGDLKMTVNYSLSFAVDTALGADDQFIGAPLTAVADFTTPAAGPVQLVAMP